MTIPGLILVNGTNKSAILTSSITESFFASGGVGFFGGSELFETSGGGADFVREFSKNGLEESSLGDSGFGNSFFFFCNMFIGSFSAFLANCGLF